MKIYGKISHLNEFSKRGKLKWDFFMGKSTVLPIELFYAKLGKISLKERARLLKLAPEIYFFKRTNSRV